jgi:hypothetical protein
MSRILKINNGDYRIKVTTGSPTDTSPAIVLDTGDGVGTVTITGNLDVKGTTSTIESVNTTVKDNILTLNHDADYTGAGISNLFYYQAGISIERGSLSPAQFLFSEQISHYDAVTRTDINGTFTLRTYDNALNGLQLRTITNDGSASLIFDLRNSASTLRIANSPAYETLVVEDNDIPNRKFVTDFIGSSIASATVSSIQYPINTNSPLASVVTSADTITFSIDSFTRGTITNFGLEVDNILLSVDTISNTSANNLRLTTNGGTVDIAAGFRLANQGSSYFTSVRASDDIGLGGTGLYTTNGTEPEGELISAKKALIFSIIF